jgi:hypothetical protein
VGNGAWPKNSKGMFIPPSLDSLGARGKGRSPGRGTGISIFKYATIVSNFETRHNFESEKKKKTENWRKERRKTIDMGTRRK